MSVNTVIKMEDHKLSFGDYTLDTKTKHDSYEVDGDIYKLKTYDKMTKLEKNGRLLYESVPGTTVTEFVLDAQSLTFTVEGKEDAQITVELESEQEYKVFIDDVLLGKIKANLAGKITFSADFVKGSQQVSIKKV